MKIVSIDKDVSIGLNTRHDTIEIEMNSLRENWWHMAVFSTESARNFGMALIAAADKADSNEKIQQEKRAEKAREDKMMQREPNNKHRKKPKGGSHA